MPFWKKQASPGKSRNAKENPPIWQMQTAKSGDFYMCANQSKSATAATENDNTESRPALPPLPLIFNDTRRNAIHRQLYKLYIIYII